MSDYPSITIHKKINFKSYLLLILIHFFVFPLFAQENRELEQLDSLYFFSREILSEVDQEVLRSIPPLKIHISNNVTLPYSVNNGSSAFFPYIFYQAALECGQASSITYGLTYETAIRRNYLDIHYNRNHHFSGYFAWNFCNGGNSAGVSFMDTWQVIRTAGSPMMPYWGSSYQQGGPTRWLSGYDAYYDGMRNRIVEMMAIPTDSEEGITILKHWLYDHGNGTQYGGIANFYSTYRAADAVLPEGTPEAGFSLMSTFTSSVNHSQTIVGYNDSIRYDFNGDGLYTNHLDLNGDGVVNVKDWEIGGVLFCNTFGQAFGTNGFCYIPYRLLASLPSEGGIWNKCVYVVRLRDEVHPQITAKATVKHNVRNMLKITAGVASNSSATMPEHTLDLNIFDYQGGALYMQGDTVESAKTLELGLDLSPLLNYIDSGATCKFFLVVDENDPDGTGTGKILNFSIMDYTGASVVEIPCSQTDVPIANNSTTLLSIEESINFSKPSIQTDIINIESFVDINEHLSATGGVSDYRWELKKEYTIEEFSADYPTPGTSNVTLSNSSSGYATIDLPFEFPCFDETYSQIVVYADGYITFRYNTYNWPFLKNSALQARTTRMLAPFRGDLANVTVTKITTEHSITLSFTGKISSQNANSVKYTVILYDTGVIEFYYGNMGYSDANFYSVISRGDAICFEYLPISGQPANLVSNRCFRLTPPKKIEGIEIYEDGSILGRVTVAFENKPLDITCYDNNDVKQSKTLYVNAVYPAPLFISDIIIDANGKDKIVAGDTVILSLTVQNVDTITLYGCNILFSCESPYINFIDSTEYFGSIASGNTYRLNNAIKFVVASHTPYGHIFYFNTLITNNNMLPSEGTQRFSVSTIDLAITNLNILDTNNNLLDANEAVACQATLANNSEFTVNDLEVRLRFDDNNTSIDNASQQISTLSPQANVSLSYNITAGSNFNPDEVMDVYFDIYINHSFFATKVFTLFYNIDCINFESPSSISAFTTDTANWYLTDQVAYTGNYALASASITHSENSDISLPCNFSQSTTVSFYCKTSTENNYDFLNFYVDGVLADRWSGTLDWALQEFEIDSGNHVLLWQYIKDYSVSSNADKVWIDDLCFMPINEEIPEIQVVPNTLNISMDKNTLLDTNLIYSSVTDNYLLFTNEILDQNGEIVDWVYTNFPNGSLNRYDSREISLTFNAYYKPVGQTFNSNLYVNVDNGNSITIPLSMTVQSPIGISDNAIEPFCVYPNPTHSIVKIDLRSCRDDIRMLIVRDLQGKILLSQTAEKEFVEIDLQPFSNGLYVIEIISNEHNYSPIKIIKN